MKKCGKIFNRHKWEEFEDDNIEPDLHQYGGRKRKLRRCVKCGTVQVLMFVGVDSFADPMDDWVTISSEDKRA